MHSPTDPILTGLWRKQDDQTARIALLVGLLERAANTLETVATPTSYAGLMAAEIRAALK